MNYLSLPRRFLFLGGLLAAISGCTAQENSHTLQPLSVAVKNSTYSGPRFRVAIGKFENRSAYGTGIFADEKDRLGMQAQQNFATHLAESNRFMVVDRLNMAEVSREATYAGIKPEVSGAQLVISGSVTEFGRKETGTIAGGGLLARSKTQTAYAKVSVTVIDVKTTQIVYAVQGAGEFDLKNETALGFGSTAGYDATLNDKVLNLAMIEAVNRIVEGLEANQWRPAP
jgi:curli biogenesis system outer membrane secretion channel CsgG